MLDKQELLKLVKVYYEKKNQSDYMKIELENLNKQIKDMLALENRKLLYLDGYVVKLEEKYEVSREFLILLKNKSLCGYITEECSITNFKKACKLLNISEDNQFKYLTKKPTQWLYVKKSGK